MGVNTYWLTLSSSDEEGESSSGSGFFRLGRVLVLACNLCLRACNPGRVEPWRRLAKRDSKLGLLVVPAVVVVVVVRAGGAELDSSGSRTETVGTGALAEAKRVESDFGRGRKGDLGRDKLYREREREGGGGRKARNEDERGGA